MRIMAKHSSNRRSKKITFTSDSSRENFHQKDSNARKKSVEKVSNWKLCHSKNVNNARMLKSLGVLLLAVTFAFINSYHQSTMFENDRHFSHLSTLEREISFRTEMGLYYYYFKVIVEAPSLWNGIYQLMHDNHTEYPSVINTLERFNLYPEVIIGAGFRTFIQIADYFQVQTRECWKVLRGDGLSPIESCEGLGEPSYFYIMSVFLLNGLVGAVIFLYGTILSDTVFGGIISALSFYFNHGECTRVQWTPPLRESFGYPMFLLQMLIVTLMLRNPKQKWDQSVVIGILTSVFILFWQFAQFALLTQLFAVFCVHILSLLPISTLRRYLEGQMLGLLMALIFLFWNKMLLTSFYSSTLIVAYIITLIDEQAKCIESKNFLKFIKMITLCIGSLFVKTILSIFLSVADDGHVWKILLSKVSSYRDFHTMLYTCANEFDFLEFETLIKLTKTLILPIGIIVIFSVSIKMIIQQNTATDDKTNNNNMACVIYNLLQVLAFFIMALLIMRLKLFFTPHLCVIASLIVSKKVFSFSNKFYSYYAGIGLLLSIMAFQGIKNIRDQRNIIGEFNNPNMEELVLWINYTTNPNAVFAGPMPTMASVLLSTKRPIVNHPHYENAALRNRTYHIYQIFSRKPADEVYQTLLTMGIEYLIVEKQWCYGKSRKGCSMADLWDVEDQENLGKEPLCQKLSREPYPFYKVFQNAAFTVLKL